MIGSMGNGNRILNISEVLDFVRERGFFSSFNRFGVGDYDLSNALQIVEAIGRERSPHFMIDNENRFTYENFIKWCHCDSTMKALDPTTRDVVPGNLNRGIYIAGNTGSGKSWCLEVMLVYALAWNFRIHFDSDREDRGLFWRIIRADEICHEYTTKGEISRFKSISILGIQDLGQEPKELLYMGNRMNVLQQLLEYRGDRSDSITLITSNLRISSDTLRSNYGDRVQSRLYEMCNYFEIKGKDRRVGLK